MVKVFLDTNILIDLVEKRGKITPDKFEDNQIFISPLSIHILMYVLKEKVPFAGLLKIIKPFSIVDFNEKISNLALFGPTQDFEDNVQLHSAADAECNIFLTQDKKIKNLKFFGKVKID